MLSIGRDGFHRDLLIWFIISLLLAGVLAAAAGSLADKYFTQMVTQLIGTVGEYDLLFQVRSDLKETALAQLRQVLQEKFPGSVLRTGISVAGKTTVFIGFTPRYRTKQVFSNLGFYFRDITGSEGYTLMTEPRLTLSGIPAGVYELFIRKAEEVSGVKFAVQDGSGIAVFLEKGGETERRVKKELQRILDSYRLLEVVFPPGHQQEQTMEIGRALTQILAGQGSISYIQDVTMGKTSDDRQALMVTMSEIRRLLLSYAGRVEITPEPGVRLEVGDLLALNGREAPPLQKGSSVSSDAIIVKVTASLKRDDQNQALPGEGSAGAGETYQGLIIQGDASMLQEPEAFLVRGAEEVGERIASVAIDSPRERLEEALTETATLLEELQGLQELPYGQVLTTVETIEAALERTGAILSVPGLPSASELAELSSLFTGINGQLQTIADTLDGLRLVEEQLDKAATGLKSAKVLLQLGLIPQLPGRYGDLNQQARQVDAEVDRLIVDLEGKAQTLKEFINRLDPSVQALLAWKPTTAELSERLKTLRRLAEEETLSDGILEETAGLTQESLKRARELESLLGGREEERGEGWNPETLKTIDLKVIATEIRKIKASLPRLKDEEIGRSIALLDGYLEGETLPGEKVRLFVNADYQKKEVLKMTQEYFGSNQVGIESTPAGSMQPDLRHELSRLLQEIKGVIAALTAFALAVLLFLLDQSVILAVLKEKERIIPIARQQKRLFLSRLSQKLSPLLYAVTLGSLWFWGVCRLSGAHIPYLNERHFLLIGGLLGLFFLTTAERFHQLNWEEITAGSSLGLSFTAIMREIIIPAGRPGLLHFINSRKMVMK